MVWGDRVTGQPIAFHVRSATRRHFDFSPRHRVKGSKETPRRPTVGKTTTFPYIRERTRKPPRKELTNDRANRLPTRSFIARDFVSQLFSLFFLNHGSPCTCKKRRAMSEDFQTSPKGETAVESSTSAPSSVGPPSGVTSSSSTVQLIDTSTAQAILRSGAG